MGHEGCALSPTGPLLSSCFLATMRKQLPPAQAITNMTFYLKSKNSELSGHVLKPLETWAKMNLDSYDIFFWYFVTMMANWQHNQWYTYVYKQELGYPKPSVLELHTDQKWPAMNTEWWQRQQYQASMVSKNTRDIGGLEASRSLREERPPQSLKKKNPANSLPNSRVRQKPQEDS